MYTFLGEKDEKSDFNDFRINLLIILGGRNDPFPFSLTDETKI